MRRLLQWWWLLRNVIVVVASVLSEPTCTETSGKESCKAQDAQDRLLSTTTTTTTSEEEEDDSTTTTNAASFSCNLFYTESNLERLGLFVGVNVSKGTVLSSSSSLLLSPEAVLPYWDVNPQQEHSWWYQDYTWEQPMVSPSLFLETTYASHVLVPGPGAFGACDNDWANVRFLRQYLVTQQPQQAASAGAYSYISNYTVVATKNIMAGQELVLPCTPMEDDDDADEDEEDDDDAMPVLDMVQDPSSLWVCVDGIRAGPSTMILPQQQQQPQLGAFATRSFAKGSVVTESPVLHLDRHQLTHANQQQVLSTFWKQFWYRHVHHNDDDDYNEDDNTPNGNKKQQQQKQQLLLNYCFGHENSTILLLPYGPVVNYMNHATGNNKANVAIRWAQRHHNASLLDLKPHQLFDQERGLALEYVALTDIASGDELLLDYGTQWEKAWNQHTQQQQWTRPPQDGHVSAATYKHTHAHNEPIRTETEQEKQPYPNNLWTVCYFKELDYDDENDDYPDDEGMVESVWSPDQLHNNDCLRPCRIVQRHVDGPNEEENDEHNYYYYTAIMERIPNYSAPDECELSEGIIHCVSGIPHHQIDLMDRPYTSDLFQTSAFRHEIGVPEGLYPDIWMKPHFPLDVSFVSSSLEPWQLQQTRWVQTKEPVDEYAYEIGLDRRIHEALLGFANRMGVTDIFRQLLIDGDAFPPDTHKEILLNGQNWYIDRPVKHWQSNMHWISPSDEPAHDDFLRVLAKAGFDDALQAIGTHFDWEGLVVYHLTFIGVSHCEKGYLHRDFTDVGGSAFNMIIPLILANETNPELELAQDEEGNTTGYYRYRYHVGSMVGDNTYHATAACDYRDQGQMRMAATIYMADVKAANLAQHLESLTQVYPPNDPSHLFNRRARHWKATNPQRRLPGPLLINDQDATLQAGQVRPVTWNHQRLGVENLYRIGLPSELQDELTRFAKQTGVYGRFHSILFRGKGSLEPQQDMFLQLKDETYWELQRLHKSSDAHYLSPADEPTFAKMLGALSRGGFDQVLAGLGLALNKATLSVYELTFMAVQHYHPMKGLAWYSADQEDDTCVEIVVPLRLAHGVGPELMVRIDDPVNLDRAFLKHSLDSAYVVGHNVESCMAPHNYAVQNEVMVVLSIRVADITPDSVDDVVANLWQHFPPEDPDFLLEKFAGRDWNQTDPSVKLASGLPEATISQE